MEEDKKEEKTDDKTLIKIDGVPAVPSGNDKIIPRQIEREMEKSYLEYAMSVIVGRALPDVKDGLKPVHRRILFGMNGLGMFHNKPYKKSARIVGEILGKYHPHGDTAVYDTMVRMAQDFSLRYPLIDGQGNFGCFTADTKVKLTDGRSLSFTELIKEDRQGKKNYAYTFNHKIQQIEIAEIKNPRLTRKKAEIMKVILDNNEEIKCTLNHKFMLRDGLYKEADQLQSGTSLMPLYTRISTPADNPEVVGYEIIYQPKSGSWDFSHYLADKFNIKNKVYTIKNGRVRHHKDFNKLNNNPDNLLRMQWKDHWLLHANMASKRHQDDINYRNKLAEGRIKFWSKKENRAKYSERLSKKNLENWKNPEYKEKMRVFLSEINKEYIKEHSEQRMVFSKRASKTLKSLWKNPRYQQLFHEKIVAANKKRITNNTGKVKFLKICKETLKQSGNLNEQNFEKQRNFVYKYGHATTWNNGFKKYFSEDKRKLFAELQQNHKVIKIEFLAEKQDVYDITIENTHNFALASGVFVHNSVDGDNPAAMRYTEARLKKIAEEMLADIDKNTVDFQPNFDSTLEEPIVLPAKLPNLLINGSSGIAVGMATNIPPHNVAEIIDAINLLIDNPDTSVSELMKYVKGPDFPTAGIISGTNGIREAYNTGRGKILVKAKSEIVEHKGKQRIIITEIPYMVNKSMLVEEIADNVKEKRIIGISDIRDESNKQGMRIVIELKKDCQPNVTLNQLYKYTRLTTTFGINMLSLVENEPKVLSLRQMMQCYITHRQKVVRRRTEFELQKAKERAHLLEGLIIALNNIDAVVQKIKKAKTVEEAKNVLMADYSLSEMQAKAILDMKLQKLSSLEQEKIREEHKQLQQTTKELIEILASEQKILSIIKTELSELRKDYADSRRTIIEAGSEEEDEIITEDLIKKEDVVVTMSHKGYVKRTPLAEYKQQGRGGIGIKAAGTRDEDYIEDLFVTTTHTNILVFTDKGKVYWLKVYDIPEASRQAAGKAIVNLISIEQGEKVNAIVPVSQFDDQHFVFFATKQGIVKKTNLSEFSRPRANGIIAINLDGDSLINVVLTDGTKEILIATANGMAVRFNENNVRPMGRTAGGVRGIEMRDNAGNITDEVIGMVLVEPAKSVLTVTENGYGKRTDVEEYRLIRRGGSGVINIQCSDRNGKVVAVECAADEDEVILISKDGTVIRTRCDGISKIGRNTQGVRVMKLREGDKVVSATKVIEE